MAKVTMDKLVALCKSRGIIYAGSEIYGGLANTWDYGHLGCEIKNNIKRAWWKKFVTGRNDVHGLDSAILMNPTVWHASGHLGGFSDPLMDCRECKTRHRADNLIENYLVKKKLEVKVAGFDNKQMQEFITENKIVCPVCGKCNFTDIKNFNLMFKTFQGVTEDSADTIYLRPETAQGIFVNFKNIARTTRAKLPFGVGQIGKSFRNEITPGNFIFRVREFEQMELEFFCKPGTDLEWFNYWKDFCHNWLLSLGIKSENLHTRDHDKDELSHYSKATTDFEYDFPFGRGELWGIADRTDYDLKCHQEKSGESLEYTDPFSGEQFIPYCIEPSVGVERLMLAFLSDAYDEEVLEGGESRIVLKLHPELAPYKVAIFPLQKNLTEQAETIYSDLLKLFSCTFDVSGNIGKRYRRQDEIGTPYCITVDYDTENDNCVTIRERDSMSQERISIDRIKAYLTEKLEW